MWKGFGGSFECRRRRRLAAGEASSSAAANRLHLQGQPPIGSRQCPQSHSSVPSQCRTLQWHPISRLIDDDETFGARNGCRLPSAAAAAAAEEEEEKRTEVKEMTSSNETNLRGNNS